VVLQLRDVDQRGLHLMIRDDGEGFDPDGPRGLGLIVMRERAQSVGGHVRIESAHGAGTLVDVHLPYQAAVTAAVESAEY
jgi:signal transduction histidine kinase